MSSAPLSVSCTCTTSTSFGPIPATSNASRAASTLGEGAISSSSEGLNTSNDPGRRVRNATERNLTGRASRRAAYSAVATTSAAAPSPGEHSMYCVSGWASIGESRMSSAESGVRRHACGVRRAIRERLYRDLGERLGRDVVIVHVALELGAEELRRHHQPVLPVPPGQRPCLGVVLERAPGMLVEADDETDIVHARLERPHCGDQRRASGGASVLDVGERELRSVRGRRPSCPRYRRPRSRRRRTACRSMRAPRRRALLGPHARPSACAETPSCRPKGWTPAPTTTISLMRERTRR